MFAKLGFVVLILLFGFLAFAGGMLAPENWRVACAAFNERLQTSLQSVKPADASRSAKSGASADAAPVSASTAAPVRLGDLMVKTMIQTPAPAKGQPVYALQLGQFLTAQEAADNVQQLQAQADSLQLPLTTVPVTDANNQPWTILAIGQFTDITSAQRIAPRVQDTLKITSTPVIQLPASPKPAS